MQSCRFTVDLITSDGHTRRVKMRVAKNHFKFKIGKAVENEVSECESNDGGENS